MTASMYIIVSIICHLKKKKKLSPQLMFALTYFKNTPTKNERHSIPQCPLNEVPRMPRDTH